MKRDEASRYCEAASKLLKRKVQLPSEAMWEYACRAGTTTPFHFGTANNGTYANTNGAVPYGTDKKGPYIGKVVKVGSNPANQWGLHDMHGNAVEWCRDFYAPYTKDSQKDPIRLTKPDKEKAYEVNRGGGASSFGRDDRSASRGGAIPGWFGTQIGFRVCIEID